jgi:hypothetical protein
MVRICTLNEKCFAKDVPLTDKHFNVFSISYNYGLRIFSMRVTKGVINMTKYDNLRLFVQLSGARDSSRWVQDRFD